MNETIFCYNPKAEDLRTLLELWPFLQIEGEHALQDIKTDQEKFLTSDSAPLAWCYLYELPIKEHLAFVLQESAVNFQDMLPPQQIIDWLNQLATSPNQIGEITNVVDLVQQHFNEVEEPSKEQVEKLRASVARSIGNVLSIINTINCILYHGCFLNELIERVRADTEDSDKALFDAIRIDPTVICCFSVSNRISKATLLKDSRFFIKLKAALGGKLAKRSQANFQKMRLVLEVLHETGASRLSDEQLHDLFVTELNLYSGNAKGGGNAKALRKFADTYMKKTTTT